MGNRIPCVRLKDMTAHGFDLRMAPVMEGNMSFKAMLKTLETLGSTKYLLVKQDVCQKSPFVSVPKKVMTFW